MRIAPSEIEGMTYTRMKYYNSWAKVFEKELKGQLEGGGF
jgi:hypothetical protein